MLARRDVDDIVEYDLRQDAASAALRVVDALAALVNSDERNSVVRLFRDAVNTCIQDGKLAMSTSIRLSPETDQRLNELAARTGRTKAFYLREAIEGYLDDMEGYNR